MLSPATSNPTTVSYLMGGSAVMGVNYTLSGSYGQVTIPPGSTTGQVVLTVLTPPTRNKKAKMILGAGPGYRLTRPKSASVTIVR
jgi:hypothetical protein